MFSPVTCFIYIHDVCEHDVPDVHENPVHLTRDSPRMSNIRFIIIICSMLQIASSFGPKAPN